jgi:tetratricopeptide (TPR) repeat protein
MTAAAMVGLRDKSTDQTPLPYCLHKGMNCLPQSPNHAAPAESSDKLSRWAAVRSQLRGRMLLLASSAVVLGIVAIAVVYWRSGAQQQEHVTLEMALGALDRHEFVRAQELAEQLRAQSVLQRLELGGPAFVMGASHVYEADERWGKDKGRAYLIAARYLEEARDRGFPTGRKEQGLRLLGRCQYLSGQYTAAAFTLNEALAANPQNPSEFHRLLVESYARDANPQFDKALAHSEMYLSDR